MPTYTHVLFATDFSPSSQMVGEKAVEIARLHGAKLSMVHVIMTLDYIYAGDLVLSPDCSHLDTSLEEMAGKALKKQAGQLGITPAAYFIENGSPARAVVEVAQDNGVDLIVLGSHGHHALDWLIGSTANGVLHGAKCDVLAVRVRD